MLPLIKTIYKQEEGKERLTQSTQPTRPSVHLASVSWWSVTLVSVVGSTVGPCSTAFYLLSTVFLQQLCHSPPPPTVTTAVYRVACAPSHLVVQCMPSAAATSNLVDRLNIADNAGINQCSRFNTHHHYDTSSPARTNAWHVRRVERKEAHFGIVGSIAVSRALVVIALNRSIEYHIAKECWNVNRL